MAKGIGLIVKKQSIKNNLIMLYTVKYRGREYGVQKIIAPSNETYEIGETVNIETHKDKNWLVANIIGKSTNT